MTENKKEITVEEITEEKVEEKKQKEYKVIAIKETFVVAMSDEDVKSIKCNVLNYQIGDIIEI